MQKNLPLLKKVLTAKQRRMEVMQYKIKNKNIMTPLLNSIRGVCPQFFIIITIINTEIKLIINT